MNFTDNITTSAAALPFYVLIASFLEGIIFQDIRGNKASRTTNSHAQIKST